VQRARDDIAGPLDDEVAESLERRARRGGRSAA
jgi:hypothetical protein